VALVDITTGLYATVGILMALVSIVMLFVLRRRGVLAEQGA